MAPNPDLILVALTPEQIAKAKAVNGPRKRITHALLCGRMDNCSAQRNSASNIGGPGTLITVSKSLRVSFGRSLARCSTRLSRRITMKSPTLRAHSTSS